MDKVKARIKDIAEMAGVSHGTVDRVIHNRGEVSEITKQKIQQIIQELNYEPDLSARRLASGKTYKLAVCIPHAQQESSFWQSPIIGIDKAISEISHLGVTSRKFLFDQFDKDSFKEKINHIIESEPDGIILAPVFSGEAYRLLRYCEQNQIPYVFINSDLEGKNNISFIGQDDNQSGRVAGKLMKNCLSEGDEVLVLHLAKSVDTHPHLKNRQKGFETIVGDKIRINHLNIKSNKDSVITHNLKAHLEKHPNTKGIFVTNSKAFKVAQFLDKHHTDLLLIGYDLTEENLIHLEKETIDYLISQKPFDQGYISVRTLFNSLVLNKPVEKEYKLPIEIIIKENVNHQNISNAL
ncbi:MAG: substrate-binding domain-containing protein [Bacteroidales bacterium]